MSDNGLAALAAALPLWMTERGTPDLAETIAATILGPRGVFLPDGLDAVREADTLEIIRLQHEWANANGDAVREQDEYHEEILALKISCDAYAGSFERASATIATLRAALDGLVEAAQMAVPALAYGAPVQAAAGLGDPEPAFRAALATAKETP